jgi:hypothetical protein
MACAADVMLTRGTPCRSTLLVRPPCLEADAPGASVWELHCTCLFPLLEDRSLRGVPGSPCLSYLSCLSPGSTEMAALTLGSRLLCAAVGTHESHSPSLANSN